MTFEVLIFDLDDTLIETTNLLTPAATREACEAMVQAGLASSVDECLATRQGQHDFSSAPDFFARVVERFGVNTMIEQAVIADLGRQAFYGREIKEHLELAPELRATLQELRRKYQLILLTAGVARTQREKISRLRLTELFHHVLIVEPHRGQFKQDEFIKILSLTGAVPARHLSIGNRLDTDIAPALALGMRGCWVRTGEQARASAATSASSLAKPDFSIHSIHELVTTCRL